jgi:DNA-binding Lrp family transcriptional regulator
MDAATGNPVFPPVSLALWRVTHLSLGYLLDTIGISRAGGDIVDSLLMGAIMEANVAPFSQDAALQMAYANLDTNPTDEMRRPVSVNAVAQSLGLPFETVRRRISAMARQGVCVITPRGVILPSALLDSAPFISMGIARYLRLKRFYFDLKAADAVPATEGARLTAATDDRGPPVRVANRILAEYMMRFIDSTQRQINDPLTVLVLLDMARANIEHLTLAEAEAAIPLPDSERRPVSVARLARRLKVPLETMRRRTAWLEAEGFCRRLPSGFVVLSVGFDRPGLHSVIGANAVNVQRLFNRLHRLGILETWDREEREAANR